MIPSTFQPLANHLWQSTLFAAAASLLTLALRRNRAQTRHWLWLAASMKFLVPFSLLVDLGSHWGRNAAPAITPPSLSYVIEQASQPFTMPAPLATAQVTAEATVNWPAVLCAFWAIGSAALIFSWWRQWRGLQAALREASPLDLQIGMQAMISPAFVEPGVFGVRRPILLLPAGITDRLTPPQLKAIVAHEQCHVRRRDNLATAIHMGVEALFWFHPLVWWLGARLMEERERACDEEVLLMGSEPATYAEGILKICELYLESPLPCVSGATGANLRRRIEAIVSNHIGQRLNPAKKLLLAGAGTAALAVPLIIGIVRAPALRAQSRGSALADPVSGRDASAAPIEATPQAAATAAPAQTPKTQSGSGPGSPEKPLEFGVASIKPHSGSSDGIPSLDLRFTPGKVASLPPGVSPRKIILEAFHLAEYQLAGGPGWLDSDRLDLEAKAAGANENQLRQMLQTLLAERFKLAVHRETRDMKVYDLTVAKRGSQLLKTGSEEEDRAKGDRMIAEARASGGRVAIFRRTMEGFVDWLNMPGGQFDRPVIDKTGLLGTYIFPLPLGQHQDLMAVIGDTLGLKFVPARATVNVYVIDRIEKPTPN